MFVLWQFTVDWRDASLSLCLPRKRSCTPASGAADSSPSVSLWTMAPIWIGPNRNATLVSPQSPFSIPSYEDIMEGRAAVSERVVLNWWHSFSCFGLLKSLLKSMYRIFKKKNLRGRLFSVSFSLVLLISWTSQVSSVSVNKLEILHFTINSLS